MRFDVRLQLISGFLFVWAGRGRRDLTDGAEELAECRAKAQGVLLPALQIITLPTMTVHSLHIFDRKGKTLFSKTYSQAAAVGQQQLRQTSQGPAEEDPVDEQRKLVFGMLFSLRELVGSLAPEGEKGGK